MYRGITICSFISKLLDIILIMRYKDKLYTSDMQFVFKERHSNVMCSLVVNEVVHYYINNKSDVYSCCLDAAKAFDRVHHDKLFELLIEMKVPAIVLRALLDIYQRQTIRTVWNGKFSSWFSTSNDKTRRCKMSCLILYIHGCLIEKGLKQKVLGAGLITIYFGSVGYADDLKLL